MTEITLDSFALATAQAAYGHTKQQFDEADTGEIVKDPLAEALQAYIITAQARNLVHGLPVIPGGVAGYEPLARALTDAYDQSAKGKGQKRHNARSRPFTAQPIMVIGRMVGIGYQTGQIQKKVQEATTMHHRGEHTAAKAELLGAIVYAAAAYLTIEEEENS